MLETNLQKKQRLVSERESVRLCWEADSGETHSSLHPIHSQHKRSICAEYCRKNQSKSDSSNPVQIILITLHLSGCLGLNITIKIQDQRLIDDVSDGDVTIAIGPLQVLELGERLEVEAGNAGKPLAKTCSLFWVAFSNPLIRRLSHHANCLAPTTEAGLTLNTHGGRSSFKVGRDLCNHQSCQKTSRGSSQPKIKPSKNIKIQISTRKRQLDNKRQSRQQSHGWGWSERNRRRNPGWIQPACLKGSTWGPKLWLSTWASLILLTEQQTHTPVCCVYLLLWTCVNRHLPDVIRENRIERQNHGDDIHTGPHVPVLGPAVWLLAAALLAAALLGLLHPAIHSKAQWVITPITQYKSKTHSHTHACPPE